MKWRRHERRNNKGTNEYNNNNNNNDNNNNNNDSNSKEGMQDMDFRSSWGVIICDVSRQMKYKELGLNLAFSARLTARAGVKPLQEPRNALLMSLSSCFPDIKVELLHQNKRSDAKVAVAFMLYLCGPCMQMPPPRWFLGCVPHGTELGLLAIISTRNSQVFEIIIMV